MNSSHLPPVTGPSQTPVTAPPPEALQAFTQPSTASTALSRARSRRAAGWATLAGAALVALGSFLPWATVLLAGPVYGTDGDGVITLGVAVLAALLGLLIGLGRGRVWMFVVTLVLGLIATAIAAYDLSNISAFVSGESMADLGAGLPVLIVGGVVVMGAAMYGVVKGRRG